MNSPFAQATGLFYFARRMDSPAIELMFNRC